MNRKTCVGGEVLTGITQKRMEPVGIWLPMGMHTRACKDMCPRVRGECALCSGVIETFMIATPPRNGESTTAWNELE